MSLKTAVQMALIPAISLISDSSNEKKNICRPSELAIYTPEPPTTQPEAKEEIPNIIEEYVKKTRLTLVKYNNEYEAYKKVAKQTMHDGKENFDWLINYLRQEDNTLPKAGAIGIGALTGLIFGLRGGFFKRTIYATTGGLAMASVCYPKEAAEYAEIGAVEGKKALTIAYNFMYGDEAGTKVEETPKK